MEKLRTRMILAYLKQKKTCTLEELMARFRVSSATIHRDAAELAKRDAVLRVRGGLVFNAAPAAQATAADFQERIVSNRREKIAVAKKALELIQEGDIVFLDSSTTVHELAVLLMQRSFAHLTIVTNAVSIMDLFRKFPAHWVLIGLGGNYDLQLNSILGASALDQLARVNITKAFFSAFGVDGKNATTNHERQAELVRTVLAAAERRYLLVDHTKLGRTGLYRLAPRGGFDAILSDAG